VSDDVVADDAPEPVAEPEPELRCGVPVTWSRGQEVLHPTRDQLLTVVGSLRDDGFWFCTDLCAVDYSAHGGDRNLPDAVAGERFEVVVNLVNHRDRQRIRLRVQVPEADPRVPSLFAIHPGTEAPEREAFDLFGITFDGHPDLTRILLPDEWVGHPLRKDHPVGRIPVQFKAAPAAR